MSNTIGENWCQEHLADQKLWRLLEKVDADLAEETRKGGCLRCEGKLHRSDYKRKARGGPEWNWRDSFCCDQDGCRRRQTPGSVRFLDRRVYAGFVVVLVSAMTHGLKPERVKRIREVLGIDQRTVERWRAWWLTNFVHGTFWKAARSRFMPRLCEQSLPLSLALSFQIGRPERLLDLLGFLVPITCRQYCAM
jgi:hypothetical protein